MKNSSDTMGNRIRDLPACSAVPQPTVPPRAPINVGGDRKLATALGTYLLCTIHSHPTIRTVEV
jgi:hypothetical protein